MQILNRRTHRTCLAVLYAVVCIGTILPGWMAAQRPNIVFIMADDLGYGDIASYGHLRIQTPHLDRLATEGTRFTQYYTSPVCSPTRCCLITG